MLWPKRVHSKDIHNQRQGQMSPERYFQKRVIAAWTSSDRKRALFPRLVSTGRKKKLSIGKDWQIMKIEKVGNGDR